MSGRSAKHRSRGGPADEARIRGPSESTEADWWTNAVDGHLGPIYRLVAARVPTDVVDDIVHDVFVGAAKGVARFDPQRGSLWAWLSGIARKQIAEYHRQTRSHRVLKADVFGLGSRDGQIRRAFESDTPLPDEICQRAEFRALARAALTALKPRHRECLIGRYFENLSLAELGARFELSRSAVNSLLHRARYELRAILLNLLDEESILEELGP